MRKYWYPIALSNDIKRNEPYGIAILGDPIVLYRDNSGEIICLSDRCPHRSVPLSLGIVKNDEIECMYHGWRFGDKGLCTHIPSISTTPSKANCGEWYPVLDRYGLVWVWPVPGDSEATEDKIPKQAFPEYFDKSYTCYIVRRDINIDHSLMIENLTDPAHVPFAHRKTIGRFGAKKMMSMEVVYDSSQIENEDDSKRPSFIPPNTPAVAVNIIYPEESLEWKKSWPMSWICPYITRFVSPITQTTNMAQIHLNIPIAPNKTRLIIMLCMNKPFFLQKYLPSVFDYFNQKVIDEDVSLLLGQHGHLTRGANPWKSVVSADKIGVRYRKWKKKVEETGEVWFKGFDTNADMEDMISPSKKGSIRKNEDALDYGGKDFRPKDVAGIMPSPPTWVIATVISVTSTLAVQWLWNNSSDIYSYVKALVL